MRGMGKKLLLSVMCVLWLPVLSGCVFKTVDTLYALPILPKEYSNLQVTIEGAMKELGAEYAAINYGSHTSTVQLLDLNGDGEQELAAVFLRVTSAPEKPMRVCLFRRGSDDSYRMSHMLEGDGTSINSVAYEDLTGDGNRELIISWQMSAGVHILSAYSLSGTGSNELMNTVYNERYLVVDLDEDGSREILVLQQDSSGENSSRAEYYDYQNGVMVMASAAPLSNGMRDVVWTAAGRLADNRLGVYATLEVEQSGGPALVTDVLTLGDGLVNVTRDRDSGISQSTIRSYREVGVKDINNDSVLEIPWPVLVPPIDRESDASPSQYLINWQQVDSHGGLVVNCVTYHSTADGWYLTVPDGWVGNITVSREDGLSGWGERSVVFYHWPDLGQGKPEPFLTIYRLTGDNRNTRARLPGRSILYNDNSTIYCASLNTGVWDCGLDGDTLKEQFHIITTEWDAQLWD